MQFMEKPKLALIRPSRHSEAQVVDNISLLALTSEADVTFLNPLDRRHNWTDLDFITGRFNGAILLGATMDYTRPTQARRLYREAIAPHVTKSIRENFPLMGICMGHQAIADIQGGLVERDEQRTELGTTQLHLVGNERKKALYDDVGQPIEMSFTHRNSVVDLPKDAEVVGYTKRDPHSVIRYADSVVTYNGHPEETDVTELELYAWILKEEPYRLEQTYPITEPSHEGQIIVNFIRSLNTLG